MAEEHNHHFFRRHKNEEKPVDVDFKKEMKHQGHLQHCAELGVAAAGAYALVWLQLGFTSNDSELTICICIFRVSYSVTKSRASVYCS